jgi:hypothetical protein
MWAVGSGSRYWAWLELRRRRRENKAEKMRRQACMQKWKWLQRVRERARED